jgi:hypothetical protein
MVCRNAKRARGRVFTEGLAEAVSAIALFQAALIYTKTPAFIGLSEDYLFQTISTGNMQCHY